MPSCSSDWLPIAIGGLHTWHCGAAHGQSRSRVHAGAYRARHAYRRQERSTHHESRVLRTLSLSQEDVDLALNYLAIRYANEARACAAAGARAISASIDLPAIRWDASSTSPRCLRETAALPFSTRCSSDGYPCRLGSRLTAQRNRAALNTREDYRIAHDRSESQCSRRLAFVTYDWQADFPTRIKAVMLPREDQERLKPIRSAWLGSPSAPGGASISSPIY